MKTITSFGIAAIVLAAAAGSALASSDGQITISKIRYAGTGCPSDVLDSAIVELAPDGKAFTVIYSSFVAEAGPGIPASSSRRNCQLNLTVFVPGGFTFAIASVDYRGYYDLAGGGKGTQKAIYYFQGQAPQATTDKVFTGPGTSDWHVREDVAAAALVWQPCGVDRSLNINNTIRVQTPSGTSSFIAQDSTDGQINTIVHFEIAPCHP